MLRIEKRELSFCYQVEVILPFSRLHQAIFSGDDCLSLLPESPISSNSRIMNTNFVEIRSEISAGTRGASLGSEAMRIAALNAGSDFFRRHPAIQLPDFNEWLFKPIEHKWAKRGEGLLEVYNHFIPKVRDLIQEHEDEFLVILAAAHGTAGASLKAIRNAHPDKRLGIIWLDAHADLHSPYTSPSGNMHGMPLALALGEDNTKLRRRDLPQETVELWEKLKETGEGLDIRSENLVLVAGRDLETEERALISERNIETIWVREFREAGAHEAARHALYHLQDCDHIYVTFDVDSMDSAVSDGTGTPVIGGINVAEARGFLKTVVRDPKVKYLEVVEVNPTLDHKANKMAEVAFGILRDVVEVIETER